MTETAASGRTRGAGTAAATLTLSLEPIGGRRGRGRLVVWILAGLIFAIFWAIQIVTGMAAGFGFMSTKEIVIRRRDSSVELVRADPPPFRSLRLMALMEQDLTALSEEAFLQRWGDPKGWKRALWERPRR